MAGGISKNESKDGFSGGASAGVPAQASGLSLLKASLKLGSRKSVKLHHFGKRTEIAVFWGGFFSGDAQRQPAVFLRGMRFGAPASWRIFLFLVGVADTLRVVVK